MVPFNLRVGNNICILPVCCGNIRKFFLNCCIKCRDTWVGNFSIGFNSATFHRLILLGGLGFLVWSDFFRFGPDDQLKAAVRGGGTLSASSSWLPYYPVDNARIFEDLIDPEVSKDEEFGIYLSAYRQSNPLNQTSWCANENRIGEWIQVSVPKSEYWQGFKISGNPTLGAYVTNVTVFLANEDGSLVKFWPFNRNTEKDKLEWPQNATSIVTYRFNTIGNEIPMNHMRIYPMEWVGPRPCLRFEAFYYG